MNQRTVALLQKAKEIKISDILNHFGCKYDKSLDYLISCPIPTHIHISNTPSFKVYKETNSFYCFGCKAAGGSAQLVQHMLRKSNAQHVSIEEALHYMEEHFDLSVFSTKNVFLRITQKIKQQEYILSDEEVAKAGFERLISLSEKGRNLNLSRFDSNRLLHKICESYGELYYQQRLLLNKFQSRETFECNINSMLEHLNKFISQCKEAESVIDATSLLE